MKRKGYTIVLDVNGHPHYYGFYYTSREAFHQINQLGFIWPTRVKEVTLNVKREVKK